MQIVNVLQRHNGMASQTGLIGSRSYLCERFDLVPINISLQLRGLTALDLRMAITSRPPLLEVSISMSLHRFRMVQE
jgi:hypothetical protein